MNEERILLSFGVHDVQTAGFVTLIASNIF